MVIFDTEYLQKAFTQKSLPCNAAKSKRTVYFTVCYVPMANFAENGAIARRTKFRAAIATASVMLSKYRKNWMLRTKTFLLKVEKPVVRHAVFQFSLSGRV